MFRQDAIGNPHDVGGDQCPRLPVSGKAAMKNDVVSLGYGKGVLVV